MFAFLMNYVERMFHHNYKNKNCDIYLCKSALTSAKTKENALTVEKQCCSHHKSILGQGIF